MTVSTEISHNEYLGNGVTTVFPYAFRIYKPTDLTVVVTGVNGSETILVLGSDYSVTGAGSYSGGNVVMVIAPGSGVRVVIARELPAVQEIDLRNQGKFFAEVHEDAFDYLTMLIQQALYGVSDLSRRAIRVPESSVSLTPSIANRRNKIFAWDYNGQPIAVLPESGSAADVLLLLGSPGGVNYVNGAVNQSELAAVADSIYFSGKTAATWGKSLQAGTALNIKCFGDSTMYGSLPPTLSQSDNNPPKMLKEALSNLTSISNNVTNYAIPGTTLYDMLRGTDGSGETYLQRLTESPCDVVYCNHCINDNQTGKDLLQYRKDLISFIKTSRENGATPILVTANPQALLYIGTTANSKRFPLFVAVMREVARDMAVDVVDNNYYMLQSLNTFKLYDIFPDGVHMSDAAYRQYGYNLAIPLITCHTISEPGDVAGLNGSTWYTNSGNAQVQLNSSRCGETLTWEKQSNATGINYPVVLNRGMPGILLSMLQWTSATKANLYINAASAGACYPTRLLGDNSKLDWDWYFKISQKLFCGLNVIGVLIDTTASTTGNGMTFSGVIVQDGSKPGFTSGSGSYHCNEMLCYADYYSLNYNFTDGTEISLVDVDGGKVASIKMTGTTLRAATFLNNAEVSGSNLSTSFSAGQQSITFRILGGSIEFSVGLLSTTIAITATISKLKLKANGAQFSLIREI